MGFRFAWLVAFLSLPVAHASAQTRAEIIRGQVKTDSGKAVAAADIIVTMAPNREIFRAASDSAGNYQLRIEKGTGDYLVYIGAAGRRPFRKRVTRSGNDSVFVVDASLAREVTTVAAVRTTAQRTPPPRDDNTSSQIGAASTLYSGVAGALSPDQMGDLISIAALIPGVTTTPDGGVSVLGVDPGQNRITLNGMSFDGTSLPRDLRVQTRVASTVFDPTIGGFGGALISSEISRGQPLTLGSAHVTLDAPQLQVADATARSLGQRYTQGTLSVGRSGEIVQDSWVYSLGVQGSHRSAPAPSLSTADAAALQRLGVSADSTDRLLAILGAEGAPVRAAGVGAALTSTNVSGAFRVDRLQSYSLGGATQDTRVRVSLSGIGAYSRNGPLGATALSSSSRDSRNTSGNLWLQGTVSQYFGKNAEYLSETKAAFSHGDRRTTPYVAAPGGSVLIASDLDDGSRSVSFLRFGGSSSALRSSTWRWEGSNELSFTPLRLPGHRIKAFTQAQLEGYRDTQANDLGSYEYNSLADLQANSPVRFTRALSLPERRAGEASGAFAIADYWTKSPTLSFVFGPRIEWNAFTRTPRDNPDVERVFGARTSGAPNSVHISPRLGFNWLYRGRQAGIVSLSGPLGNFFFAPRGVLKGGIGEFRAPYSPTLLSSAIVGTGLVGSTALRLTCVGPAVPTPSWAAISSNSAAVPSTCADGSAAFSDAAPSVQLFDPSYTAARRWTANLNWSSAWRFVLYSVDAAYSLNLDQPGLVDLNYSGRQQFSLGNEADRPVFVAPTSIVPGTGLASPLDARISNAFGRVVSRRSDLRSDVKQGTISITPVPSQRLAQFFLNGSYTYSASRSLTSGFDESTFGDPRARAWSIGPIPEHQLRVQGGYRFRKLNSSVTALWILQSGYAYSPIVGGDINGDGLANDRAFIFDPRSASPGVAAGMRDLLSSTTGAAHDCLQRQVGTVAGRNSCRRPWSAVMNARWSFDHRFGDRFHYFSGSINFANPLAGLDQLLHGANHLRGWGLPALPDPTLYYVRGFDQSTKQFIYDVNPQFGKTRPSLSALYNPFRVTIDISVSLNGNVLRQRAEQMIRPTRSTPNTPPPTDTIFRRLRSSGLSAPSPFYWIVANADSLLLSPEQLRAVTAALDRQQSRIDSTFRALAQELSRLPKDRDLDLVAKSISDAENTAFQKIPRQEATALTTILTPLQFRLLPANFATSFDISPPKP